MPEGDTIWRAARTLGNALAGQLITSSDFRVPAHATADLRGWRVDSVVSIGKHLMLRCSPPDHGDAAGSSAAGIRPAPARGLTVHSHLGMDGRWQVFPAARTPRLSHRTRVVLRTTETVAIGQALPVLELIRTANENQAVGHLGPDILGPDWDEQAAVANLLRAPTASVGDALLDQRHLAGIGNVYRNEVLFIERVHPLTPVADVVDLLAVVRTAATLLLRNRERAVRNTTGLTGRGQDLFVYGRAGLPCRRCRSTISRADSTGQTSAGTTRPPRFTAEPAGVEGFRQPRSGPHVRESAHTPARAADERIVFWCPTCQPLAHKP